MLAAIICTTSFSAIHAQSKAYSITRSGKKIGTVNTRVTNTSNQKKYKIDSDVKFKVLWRKYHRTTDVELTYEDGLFKSGYLRAYMNGELKDSVEITSSGGEWNLFKYPSKREKTRNLGANFTASLLYFEEPDGISDIYSMRFLDTGSLKALGNSRYQLRLPNGKRNYYTYSSDGLEEISINRKLFKIKINHTP